MTQTLSGTVSEGSWRRGGFWSLCIHLRVVRPGQAIASPLPHEHKSCCIVGLRSYCCQTGEEKMVLSNDALDMKIA